MMRDQTIPPTVHYTWPCGVGECFHDLDDGQRTAVNSVLWTLEMLVAPRGTNSVLGAMALFCVQREDDQRNFAFLASTYRKGSFKGEFYRCGDLPH
eukprot:1794840-Karenia_brevis.AAC.1